MARRSNSFNPDANSHSNIPDNQETNKNII